MTATRPLRKDAVRNRALLVEAAREVFARRGLEASMMGVQDPQSKVEIHDRLLGPIEALLRRCQDAGAVRADAAVSDLGFVILMLCQVADVAGNVDQSLWRRYLPTLLSGLRPDGPPLDGQALDNDAFRAASAAHHACHARGAR